MQCHCIVKYIVPQSSVQCHAVHLRAVCSVQCCSVQCEFAFVPCGAVQLVLRSWEGAGGASVFITNTGGLYHLPHLMRIVKLVVIISRGMM